MAKINKSCTREQRLEAHRLKMAFKRERNRQPFQRFTPVRNGRLQLRQHTEYLRLKLIGFPDDEAVKKSVLATYPAPRWPGSRLESIHRGIMKQARYLARRAQRSK